MYELRLPLLFPSIPDQHLMYVLMNVLIVSSICGFPTQNFFVSIKKGCRIITVWSGILYRTLTSGSRSRPLLLLRVDTWNERCVCPSGSQLSRVSGECGLGPRAPIPLAAKACLCDVKADACNILVIQRNNLTEISNETDVYIPHTTRLSIYLQGR